MNYCNKYIFNYSVDGQILYWDGVSDISQAHFEIGTHIATMGIYHKQSKYVLFEYNIWVKYLYRN